MKNTWTKFHGFRFLPGPITAPRYQLPALPILTLMAAFGLIQGWDWVKRRRKER